MQRVMVIGCGGAGKSTLATKLGQRLALPVIHLDRHYWGPGWTASESAAWRERVTQLAAGPAWIMDGDYSSSYDIRLPRADTLVWLDYRRAICLRRILRRSLRSKLGSRRPDLPSGCDEHIDFAFLRYVWDFPARHRHRIVRAIEQHGSHLRLIHLAADRDADRFLDGVGAG